MALADCASHREAVCSRMRCSHDFSAKKRLTTETQRHRKSFSFEFQVSSFKWWGGTISKLKNSLCLCVSVVNRFFVQKSREYLIREQTASRCEAQSVSAMLQQSVGNEFGHGSLAGANRLVAKPCL